MDAVNSVTNNGSTVDTQPVSSVGRVSSDSSQSSATTPGTSTGSSDSIQISPQGTQAAKYVQAASAAVEPPSKETIAKLKAAIAKGQYPAPALVDGLINLTGANLLQSSNDFS